MQDLKQRVEAAINGKLHFQEMEDLIVDLFQHINTLETRD